MAWELLLWLVAFVSVISLIALCVYQLICLSDLEFDYINPYDSSARINAVVFPEFAMQAALCAVFLLTWHWFPFLLMAPITYYHWRLICAAEAYLHVTEIFSVLNGEKKYRMIKIAFYISLFFIVIYRYVSSLL
ncbi:hypothetical protein QJS10_CPA10g00156 [Acorus calamus]|uniref:Uncharacterized protein n=1 Tax=Acorus calamus TaxID=4465 RepID=A0AAV9E0S6_ACOCL|nr:hypothetical protein QJS10_CPA10g00156 [Acorus calamus]